MPTDKRHTVEGYWDCQYCGTKGIPGRFKSCTGCSHPRDASVKFYTKEIGEDRAITREEFERQQAEADKNSRSDSANYTEAQQVSSGESLFSQEAGATRDKQDESDWYCDFCDSYNPASAEVCQFCGATREMGGGKTYRETQGQTARTYDSKGNLVKERDLAHKEQAPAAAAAPASGPGCLKIALIAIGLIALVAVVSTILTRPRSKTVEVASFDWEQTIEIEELQTATKDGWTMPDGARLVRAQQEVKTYEQVVDRYESVPYQVSEQVLDHYETYTTTVDNGDGTFDVEEHDEPVYRTEYRTEYRDEPVYVSVPVYDTKYYYEIEEWTVVDAVTTSGEDHDPYWGEVELAEAEGTDNIGAQREGARYGTYGMYDSEGDYYLLDEDAWRGLEVGQKVELTVDTSGHATLK